MRCKRPHRRLIQRWHAARLLDLDIRRPAVARDVKRHIDPLRMRDARVHFVLQPVLRNFLLHHPHVPGVAGCQNRPPPPVKSKPPLAPPALNIPYGPLTGPPSPNGTTLLASSCGGCGSGFRRVGVRWLWLGLLFGFLLRNRNRVRVLSLPTVLGLRFRHALGLVRQHVLGLHWIGAAEAR